MSSPFFGLSERYQLKFGCNKQLNEKRRSNRKFNRDLAKAKEKYKDLRDFMAMLEARGELVRIKQEIDPHLEMTEISDRTLKAGGPALLFENPKGYDNPVLTNLFGTPERVALGMGQRDVTELREVGKVLAALKEPEPPKGVRDAWDKLPIYKQVLHMGPKLVKKAP